MHSQSTENRSPKGQTQRPVDLAPRILRDHGYCDAHSWPLVSQMQGGKIIRSHRASPALAWQHYRHIQLDPQNAFSTIVVDCDDPEMVKDVLRGGWPPTVARANYMVVSTITGHAHLVWFLDPPVHANPHSTGWQKDAHRALRHHYTAALNGDRSYCGPLTLNPLASAHQGNAITHWMHKGGRTLKELAAPVGGLKSVFARWKCTRDQRRTRLSKREAERAQEGRNSRIHVRLNAHFTDPANRADSVQELAEQFNREEATPLGAGELAGIIRSVKARLAERSAGVNLPAKYTPNRQEQAALGRESGKARRARTAARDAAIVLSCVAGKPFRQIAVEQSISVSQVSRVLQRDAPGIAAVWQENAQQVVDAIIHMHECGNSQRSIARVLRVGRGRVRRTLRTLTR